LLRTNDEHAINLRSSDDHPKRQSIADFWQENDRFDIKSTVLISNQQFLGTPTTI